MSEKKPELTPYEQLCALTQDGRGKIDPYTMFQYSYAKEQGEDVETVSVPMLAMIRERDFEEIRENATIYSRIGNIVALSATPAQLLRLAQMDGVLSLEASRPGGSFDN